MKYKSMVAACISIRFMTGALLVFFGMEYLKASKFFVDSYIVYSLYRNLDGYQNILRFTPFDSFNNTAKIYKLLFFNQNFSFELFIILASLLYCLLFIYFVKSTEIKNHQTAFIVFLLFFVFDMIFLFQPSKDFFSLLINVLILKLILSDRKGKDIFLIIAASLYALLFREYYFAILLLFYFLRLAVNIGFKARILLFVLSAAGFCAIFYGTNYFDEIILLRYHSFRLLSDFTNTVIQDVFPSLPGEKNILKYAANYLVVALRLLFPVEVLWKSPSRGIIFFPLQLIIDYILFRYIPVVSHYLKNKKTMPEDMRKEAEIITRIFLYIVSFFLVAVLFEPDFGSVFRHSINLMPYVLYLGFSASYKLFDKSKSIAAD